MTRVLLVLAFLACNVRADEGKPVRLKAEDGRAIAGTYWAPKRKAAAAVVLLPDAGGTRADFAPLIPHMLARQLAVLAIDPRAGGEQKAAAHLDAIAAVRWLSKKHKRVGIVGAGLGCSAAFEAARAHPKEVAALLGMTPRAADGKLLPKTLPIALVAHREDAKSLAASFPTCELRLLKDERPEGQTDDKAYFVGTKMFGRVPLIEPWVAGVMAVRLGAMPHEALLDGALDPIFETKATALEKRKGGRAYAYLAGRRLVFGGTLPDGITLLRFKVLATCGKVSRKGLEGGKGLLSGSRKLPAYSFLGVLLEAPTAYVRECNKSSGWKDARPGGMAPPSRFAVAPIRIAFAPSKNGYSFEGELMLPELKKRKQVVEVGWGWEEKLGNRPPIRFGPGGELDLRGEWVKVPARK